MHHDIARLHILADTYLHQTAYLDAREVHRRIAEMTADRHGLELYHANSLQEIVGIDVELARYETKEEVVAALEPSQDIFRKHGYRLNESTRHFILGNTFQRDGQWKKAEELFSLSRHNANPALVVLSLVKMADLTLNTPTTTISWAVILLAYSKTKGSAHGIPWALLYLAKALGPELDAESRLAVFDVALEEFGRMGIYRGRAECLQELADEQGGDELRAEAREMFLQCGLTARAAASAEK